ncbi:MAG: RNA-protein complex protein Nop10 [Thermoprotei archaeon]|nr:MAG: ribosome biogenesis protein [Thermofilum sp. ex4484_79]RLF08217.1 MAG: RNA-protein complex protein Nop10 [Thermoprotei archaeon]
MPKGTFLKRCKNCGRYTLEAEKCPYCGGKVVSAHPPKFSPEDKYGGYRRKMKLLYLKNDP